MAAKNVTIKLVKSPAGRLKKQKACVAGLGLRRLGDEVVREDTESVRGMINKIEIWNPDLLEDLDNKISDNNKDAFNELAEKIIL